MIAYARCPYTLAIGFFPVFKPESVIINVNTVKRVTAEVPVDKVFRLQHHKARITVHGCSH